MDGMKWDEDGYHALVNLMDQGFFIIDITFDENDKPIDMYYAEANAAATKMLGLDYTGRRLREMDPNDEEYWLEIFGNVALTGQSVRLERYAQPDKKWYSYYIFKIGDEKSRRIGNMFFDITERKRAEDALRESETKYREIMEHAPAGIYEVDFRTGRFVSVNDVMCMISGTAGRNCSVCPRSRCWMRKAQKGSIKG
ncbi:MAG: PAS domain-containing protein [Bacillota bacterium]